MIYRDLLEKLHDEIGVSQVGLLKQQGDAGEIAVLGRKEEIVFPFRPASGFYQVYLNARVFTVIHEEVIEAIYRQFSNG